jgi:hypothetical protein
LLYAQRHSVSGIIFGKENRELLIGATILEKNSNNGTVSDKNGFFSIKIASDSIIFRYIGHESKAIRITNDTVLNIYLSSNAFIEEVEIRRNTSIHGNTVSLSNEELMSIPSLTGKPDVLKTLQLIPGIEGQGEGMSTISVRGGNSGENLYLIDDVQLYYVNHLGGFYSVFNPDMINNIEVHKSNFPAKYGGKLSSVLSIKQREGNKKSWKGNFGIGITDASFSVEGPIINDTMSLIINGRKTFVDPILAAITLAADQDYFLYYGFHDLNAKWSYRPDQLNSYHLNVYYGDDYLNYHLNPLDPTDDKFRFTNRWGNYLISGKWIRVINDKMYFNNTLSITKYRVRRTNYYVEVDKDTVEVEAMKDRLRSSIRDISFRSDWSYYFLPNWKMEYGMEIKTIKNNPNEILFGNYMGSEIPPQNSIEASIYQSNEINLSRFLTLNLGLRSANFFSSSYTVSKLDPRLSLNVHLSENTFGIHYQKVNQFLHLLLTSGALFNSEVWVSSDSDIPVSASEQYGISWTSRLFDDKYSLDIDVYRKHSSSLSIYKEGYFNLLGDGNWKSKVVSGGTSESKGLEVLFRKNRGRVTGFLSYTYSRTTMQFDEVNNGETFVYDYNRPHSFSTAMNYLITERFSLNLAWVYHTGLPYTPIIARHISYLEGEQFEALLYGKKNSDRMKDYHRLDVALRYTKQTRKGRTAEWSLSVYNAYNRKNANSYFYNYALNYYYWVELDDLPILKQYQNSFFPIIPVISYRLNFGDN